MEGINSTDFSAYEKHYPSTTLFKILDEVESQLRMLKSPHERMLCQTDLDYCHAMNDAIEAVDQVRKIVREYVAQ